MKNLIAFVMALTSVLVGLVVDPPQAPAAVVSLNDMTLVAVVHTRGEYDDAGLQNWNGQPISPTNHPTYDQDQLSADWNFYVDPNAPSNLFIVVQNVYDTQYSDIFGTPFSLVALTGFNFSLPTTQSADSFSNQSAVSGEELLGPTGNSTPLTTTPGWNLNQVSGSSGSFAYQISTPTVSDAFTHFPTVNGDTRIFGGGVFKLSFPPNINLLRDVNFANLRANASNGLGKYIEAGSLTFVSLPTPTQSPPIAAFPPSSQLAGSLPLLLKMYPNAFDPGVYAYLIPLANALAPFKSVIGSVGTGLSTAYAIYGIAESLTLLSVDILAGDVWAAELDQALLMAELVAPTDTKLFTDGGITAVGVLQSVASGRLELALIDIDAYLWGDVVASQAEQFAKSDPPDPNFQQIYLLPSVTLPAITTGISALDASFALSSTDALNAALDLQAAIISINRYSSAVAAGDALSATLQLEALTYYLTRYQMAIESAINDVPMLLVALNNNGLLQPMPTTSLLTAVQQNLALNGFSSSVITTLLGLGLTNTDITNIRQNIIALPPIGASTFSNAVSQIPAIISTAGVPFIQLVVAPE